MDLNNRGEDQVSIQSQVVFPYQKNLHRCCEKSELSGAELSWLDRTIRDSLLMLWPACVALLFRRGKQTDRTVWWGGGM